MSNQYELRLGYSYYSQAMKQDTVYYEGRFALFYLKSKYDIEGRTFSNNVIVRII